jgi:UDP-N-acetylmuramate dehydrogenase
MDMAELERIAQHGLAGEFRRNEPMAKHTSWRTGGPADHAYFPRDLADCARFVRTIPKDEPLYVVGLGSNLLVRDGGLRGTVVFTHGALNGLRLEQGDGREPLLYAEAGIASPKVARYAATHDLRRAEFLAGIPGTVGGALAMNAGCYGSETWEIVDSVLCLSHDGELVRRPPSDFEIAYRHVLLRSPDVPDHQSDEREAGGHVAPGGSRLVPRVDEWFAAAWFGLAHGNGEESRRVIKELLQRRISTQPLEQPNAGSVFRNPPGDYAARLIESCGFKGFAVGGAMVSPKHANFIINAGGALAADIESLIEQVQRTVWDKYSVQLEREVRIIGERV